MRALALSRRARASLEQLMDRNLAYSMSHWFVREWWFDSLTRLGAWAWIAPPSSYTDGVLDLSGDEHTQPSFTNLSFEDDFTGWGTGGAVTREIRTDDPMTGPKYARVSGSSAYIQRLSFFTTGCRYTGRGWGRGDGSNPPRLWHSIPNIIFLGNSSATWQRYTGEFTATGDILVAGFNGVTDYDGLEFENRSLLRTPGPYLIGTPATQSTSTSQPWVKDSGTLASPGRRVMEFVASDYMTVALASMQDWTLYTVLDGAETAVGISNTGGLRLSSGTLRFFDGASTHVGPAYAGKSLFTIDKMGTAAKLRVNDGVPQDKVIANVAANQVALNAIVGQGVYTGQTQHGVVLVPHIELGGATDQYIKKILAATNGVAL